MFIGIEISSGERKPNSNEDNVNKILTWVDSNGNNWKGGGTNFEAAFAAAFDIIKRSVDGGQTSMCQKAILFMTDGEDSSFTNDKFAVVKDKATKYDAFVFGYALGSGADTVAPKRLACENRGIYYQVADGGALDAVMARFYDYFVQGQEICSASWVKYSAAGSGTELYTGCLPMYDRTSSQGGLMGVTCMDVGLVKKVSDMKTEAGWGHFVCQISDVTKKCRSVSLTECDRQKMRLAYSSDSVCTANTDADATASAVCQCTHPNCQDDDSFVDGRQYFCDTWVGDNCDEADTKWGYTTAQMNEILQKCKRSCGKCPLQSEAQCTGARTSPDECQTIAIEDTCRACRGKVSGVDIEGNAMCCPGQACSGGGAAAGGNSNGGDPVSGASGASSSFSAYFTVFAIRLPLAHDI